MAIKGERARKYDQFYKLTKNINRIVVLITQKGVPEFNDGALSEIKEQGEAIVQLANDLLGAGANLTEHEQGMADLRAALSAEEDDAKKRIEKEVEEWENRKQDPEVQEKLRRSEEEIDSKSHGFEFANLDNSGPEGTSHVSNYSNDSDPDSPDPDYSDDPNDDSPDEVSNLTAFDHYRDYHPFDND